MSETDMIQAFRLLRLKRENNRLKRQHQRELLELEAWYEQRFAEKRAARSIKREERQRAYSTEVHNRFLQCQRMFGGVR